MLLDDLKNVKNACHELLEYIDEYELRGKLITIERKDDPHFYCPHLPKESGMIKAQSLILTRLLVNLRKSTRNNTDLEWKRLIKK